MTQPVEIPQWMIPASEPIPNTPSLVQVKKELREAQFENFFETVLVKLEQGIALTEILRDDQRDFDYAGLLRWIHKDPQRKSRYYEAQEIGTEMIMAECIEIADGKDGLEDVQRSKLRIDTRLFQAKSWNRKRYGDVKTLEVNQNISITAALEQANNRLTGRIIEHDLLEDE